jgi:hypothetical protein
MVIVSGVTPVAIDGVPLHIIFNEAPLAVIPTTGKSTVNA